jgi:hypothetical protein
MWKVLQALAEAPKRRSLTLPVRSKEVVVYLSLETAPLACEVPTGNRPGLKQQAMPNSLSLFCGNLVVVLSPVLPMMQHVQEDCTKIRLCSTVPSSRTIQSSRCSLLWDSEPPFPPLRCFLIFGEI